MYPKQIKHVRRRRRQLRVRRGMVGSPDRPRLAVFRSLKHMSAQIIDDFAGRTLVAASTTQQDVHSQLKSGGNKDAAAVVGRVIGELARAKGITKVCFDRRHYKYHGRVQALAEAARKAGLEF